MKKKTVPEAGHLVLPSHFSQERVQQCSLEKKCPVVTISRTYAANGTPIAELLADFLTVPCFGRALLDAAVAHLHIDEDKHVQDLLHERVPKSSLFDWVHSFSNAGVVARAKFDAQLVRTILAIAKSGGVIIGHAAHLILDNQPNVFRVRIEGSVDVCARRIVDVQKEMDLSAARAMVAQINEERERFVQEVFAKHPSKRVGYDLVLNSDQLESQAAVEVILYTMEKMGYYVPGSDILESQDL